MNKVVHTEELFSKLERLVIRLLLFVLLLIVAVKVIAKELEPLIPQ